MNIYDEIEKIVNEQYFFTKGKTDRINHMHTQAKIKNLIDICVEKAVDETKFKQKTAMSYMTPERQKDYLRHIELLNS